VVKVGEKLIVLDVASGAQLVRIGDIVLVPVIAALAQLVPLV